jgi:hypothetical protein
MRVRMMTTMAGPDIDTHNAGAIVEDFDDAKARELIDGGYAVEVDERGLPIKKVGPTTQAETNELNARRKAAEDALRDRKAMQELNPAPLPTPPVPPPPQGAVQEHPSQVSAKQSPPPQGAAKGK